MVLLWLQSDPRVPERGIASGPPWATPQIYQEMHPALCSLRDLFLTGVAAPNMTRIAEADRYVVSRYVSAGPNEDAYRLSLAFRDRLLTASSLIHLSSGGTATGAECIQDQLEVESSHRPDLYYVHLVDAGPHSLTFFELCR